MTARLISTITQPVTLAEAKAHLRVEHTDDDALITMTIAAATQAAEQHTGRSLALNTWTLKLDAFPAGGIILPWPPTIAVSAVTYIDTDGVTQTMDAAEYVLDSHSEPARLMPATEWPDTYDSANAVTVTYTAGYGTVCPEAIKAWILLRVGAMYENRESVTAGQSMTDAPRDFSHGLLDRFRVYA